MSDNNQNAPACIAHPDRTIVFEQDIHPFHILRPKAKGLKSDFVWYLRDSRRNGLVHVDYICNEKIRALGKITGTWRYYSIPFGLLKTGWEIMDVSNPKQMKKIILMTSADSISQIKTLLGMLETIKVDELGIAPEIPKLLSIPISDDEEKEWDESASVAKRFLPRTQLYPTEKQVSDYNSQGVFRKCSFTNLNKVTQGLNSIVEIEKDMSPIKRVFNIFKRAEKKSNSLPGLSGIDNIVG